MLYILLQQEDQGNDLIVSEIDLILILYSNSIEELCKTDLFGINVLADDGKTALHIATANKKLSCVQILIKYGASVEIEDAVENLTPLMWACKQGGELDCISALLKGIIIVIA